MTIIATRPVRLASPKPQMAEISDAKPSELVEAVTALNMERSLKTSKRSSPSPNQIDSGYASKSSTPESSIFGPFVVENAPILSLTRRKRTKLAPFEKEISQYTQDRFEDLRELYAESLSLLASGISKRRGILMTLKVLGESEETAEPWVFVQCDKTIAKKVRSFFKRSSVASVFNPQNPSKFTPKLNVYVHELPPLPLGRNPQPSSTSTQLTLNHFKSAELYIEGSRSRYESLCGLKIMVEVNEQWRFATIGGIISIEDTNGCIKKFGITAGHFLNEDCDIGDEEKESHRELETDEEETDDDADDGCFDDENDFELDLRPAEDTASTNLVNITTAKSDTLTLPTMRIGKVFWTSQKNVQCRPNLDWALFTLRPTTLEVPNIIQHREITETDTEDLVKVRDVILSTASSITYSGTLSSSWSYLALAPGNCLVRTKAMKLAGNRALESGDSGAWVIDATSSQLYGHVVASDVFGVSYVIPASDVFKDIQQRLSFKAVKLPTRTLNTAEAQVPRPDEPSQDQDNDAGTESTAHCTAPKLGANISVAKPAREAFVKSTDGYESAKAKPATQLEAPKAKKGILQRVLRKLGFSSMNRPEAKASTILLEVSAATSFQVPQSNSQLSNAPAKGYSDSGYSTMANTPRGSKRTSPTQSAEL